MHELLRQFVEEKLATDADEHQEVLDTHCRYYARLLQQFEIESNRVISAVQEICQNATPDSSSV